MFPHHLNGENSEMELFQTEASLVVSGNSYVCMNQPSLGIVGGKQVV